MPIEFLDPTHEASVAAMMPSSTPATVLTKLEGIGKKMSVANTPITSDAIVASEGGGSSQPRTQASITSPNSTKGTIGTSTARRMISSSRGELGMTSFVAC